MRDMWKPLGPNWLCSKIYEILRSIEFIDLMNLAKHCNQARGRTLAREHTQATAAEDKPGKTAALAAIE